MTLQIRSAKSWRFPDAFNTLIALISAIATLTWVKSSDQYKSVVSEALGWTVPVPGSYALTPGNPQGIVDMTLSPIAGLYDPEAMPPVTSMRRSSCSSSVDLSALSRPLRDSFGYPPRHAAP